MDWSQIISIGRNGNWPAEMFPMRWPNFNCGRSLVFFIFLYFFITWAIYPKKTTYTNAIGTFYNHMNAAVLVWISKKKNGINWQGKYKIGLKKMQFAIMNWGVLGGKHAIINTDFKNKFKVKRNMPWISRYVYEFIKINSIYLSL